MTNITATMSAYTVNQRTKEVGIRKVLGASVSSIITLLSRDIYKLLAGAILLAVPLSWYAMNQWLNNFAYRINIDLEIYALAAVVALSIATITTSWQAVRAASSNPVNELRNE